MSELWPQNSEGGGPRFRNASTFGDSSGGLDEIILRATEWCPGLSPSVLKALLVQESGLDPTVINGYGYAGIAQIGRDEAREVGLYVGFAGSSSDERLNPRKAIPAAARLLDLKAQRLGQAVFSRYGQPEGIEYWKFVLAAYNGGEGTIALAMGNAHRRGLALARARGLIANEAVDFARGYASRWGNLIAGGPQSPLAVAASRYFPAISFRKYVEISGYPEAILGRCLGPAFRSR
jgi:soluble lytic murein transglycosylase-like protein